MPEIEEVQEHQKAIGIDLGTTYSCVGVWQNDTVEIIANDQGNRTTPSYVAFTDSERLIGDQQKNQQQRNPTNTVFDQKRLIGRPMSDENVQQDQKLWPFNVVQDQQGQPLIKVVQAGSEKEFHPEEISSMVLMKMKEIAEDFIGSDVKDQVITVPAYFNDSQRQQTKDQQSIQGLNCLRIINEPTQQQIAYGLDKKNQDNKKQNILIYDMGGGTFDVSILSLEDGVFEVKQTQGDTHLGGEDFDHRIVSHCIKEFEKKNKDCKLEGNQRQLRRLRTQCEKQKRTLSSNTVQTIEIDSLQNGEDFSFSLTRQKFEELCMDYFKNSMEPVQKCLKDSGLKKSQISEVVLVGGSTRIPKVQQLLQDFFEGKELCRSINPDEQVQYGQTVQQAILNGDQQDQLQDLLLLDVTPLSLGLETEGGVMTKLIERNTTIPCKKMDTFTTCQDNQTTIEVCIYEGERVKVKDNNLLGKFNLDGIAPQPRGHQQVEIEYELDQNGILHVSQKDRASLKKNNITINNDKGRLTQQEIDRMIEEQEQSKQEDKKFEEKLKQQRDLTEYLYQQDQMCENEALFSKLSDDQQEMMHELIQESLEWQEKNPSLERMEFVLKQREVEKKLKPLMTKMYQEEQGAGKKQRKGRGQRGGRR